MKNQFRFLEPCLLAALVALAWTPSSAGSWQNSDVVVGEDVVINGPVQRGANRSNTAISNNMSVGSSGVVMPGMRVGNGVYIDDDSYDDVYIDDGIVTNGSSVNTSVSNRVVNGNATTKSKTKIKTTKNGKTITRYVEGDPKDMGKTYYRSGDCIVKRKWVGSMYKEDITCK